MKRRGIKADILLNPRDRHRAKCGRSYRFDGKPINM